ncbi:MAG: hypothetical protein GY731_17275, partial [Gammaproteobacteria bacterium]|nr:hypothetical protein [Gammaproteobacteria bacterium]
MHPNVQATFHPQHPSTPNTQPSSMQGIDVNKTGEGLPPGEVVEPLGKESTQQLLNQQILAALNRHLEMGGAAPIQDLHPVDFTPEKVAERILQFVGAAIGQARGNGADDEKLAHMMEQARQGVEKGFQQAREILSGLGVLEGRIADDVNQTYDLIQKGLDRLEGEGLATANRTESMLSADYRKETTLSLEIRTRDGDVVTIDVEKLSGASQSKYARDDGNSTVLVSEHNTTARASLQYRVTGEIDAEEREALEHLIGRIDEVADTFYEGNVNEALQLVEEFDLDTTELAGFTLSLSQVETSRATSAYQSVSGYGEEGQIPPGMVNRMMPLGQVLQDLRTAMNDEQLNRLVETPQQVLHEFLRDRVRIDNRFDDVFGGLNKEADDMLEQVVNNLIEMAGRF